MTKTQNIKISKSDIVASLKPLIDEYFSGQIKEDDGKIIYTAENGQTFKIEVTQV